MKIKGLYQSSLVHHWVVQLPNNKFYVFYATPFREISEAGVYIWRFATRGELEARNLYEHII